MGLKRRDCPLFQHGSFIMKNRQRGALIGLAVGDALGAAVEFKSPGTFPEVTGYPRKTFPIFLRIRIRAVTLR
jgi:ADP-ribosylglycohydrolase